jgi:hypothetical protein
MRKIILRLALGAGLVSGFGACSDGLVDPQLREAPAGISASYSVTTEYRYYHCWNERGWHIWLDSEIWARDTYTHDDSSVTYGEPYYVETISYDTGPTSGIGYLQCDYYPGYW